MNRRPHLPNQRNDELTKRHLRWTAKTTHVDRQTGEKLTPKQIKDGNYKKIDTTKDYKFTSTTGTVLWTILYERDPQIGIQFTTTA